MYYIDDLLYTGVTTSNDNFYYDYVIASDSSKPYYFIKAYLEKNQASNVFSGINEISNNPYQCYFYYWPFLINPDTDCPTDAINTGNAASNPHLNYMEECGADLFLESDIFFKFSLRDVIANSEPIPLKYKFTSSLAFDTDADPGSADHSYFDDVGETSIDLVVLDQAIVTALGNTIGKYSDYMSLAMSIRSNENQL